MKRLIYDSEICVGCKNCEMACSLIHINESPGNASRIKIYPLIDGIIFASTLCQQCSPPLCLKKCEPQALSKDLETGVVRLDTGKCTKCYLCVDACPYGAIYIPAPDGFPIKCEICEGNPTCVRFCPTQALRYGEEDRRLTKKQRSMAIRLKKTNAQGARQ